MRFFVPSATDSRQAEEVYRHIRERVLASFGSLSEKRIYRLRYQDRGQVNTVVIGSDRHTFGTNPVVAIFEGSGGAHYVCTQGQGEFNVSPHPVQSNAVLDVEGFSALA